MNRKSPSWRRRNFLVAMSAAACMPTRAVQSNSTLLAASWQRGAQQHLGLLSAAEGRLRQVAAMVLPTRAHGVLVESDGSLVAIARRPGDWLLRWHPLSSEANWQWLESDMRLNGHGAHVGESFFITSETDRESSQGWLGVRDRSTLKTLDMWPTHGRDPHDMLVLPDALGRWPAGTLMVANGGVTTRPETGRSKVYGERLDASLVAIDPKTGKLQGQWRLGDPYLSIRHLAWNPQSHTLGIALQAAHANAAERNLAPVLATWDGESLTPARNQPGLGGYGGDVVYVPFGSAGSFAVGCTLGNSVVIFSADGRFVQAEAHPGACALASKHDGWWNAGRNSVLSLRWPSLGLTPPKGSSLAWTTELQIDNHWQHWS